MAEVLRPFVLLLVLLNLVFVHLTGVVDLAWLLPLYALTLASPLLCRLQHRLLYRLAWNLAVIVLSLALLHHALTTGLLHMLEDGLVLAALCQVHVLNNVGVRQRPDLLFFNSFLIAFVTSFFCQDAAYSGVFLAYAAVLLPSLQLFVVLRNGGAPSRSLVTGVLRDSVPRTALVLTCTGLVFLFWPRNFDREGWLESRFDLAGRRLEVGFAEEGVRLGRTGDVVQSDQEVMRVRILQGVPEVVPRHWRGATFVDFRTGGWAAEPNLSGPHGSSDQEWQQIEGGWQRIAGRAEATLTVHLRDSTGQRLFLPLHAGAVVMLPGHEGPALPHADGTFGFQREPGRNYATQPLDYRVTACRAPARPAPVSPFLLHRLDFVEEDLMPREIEGLARLIRNQKILPTAGDAEVARAFERWLAANRTYALPGERNAARGITEFLTGVAGGHCEYFATTLALLLRHEHIGCRVVTGYLASEWDASGQELIIRRKHAHAWVEAMLPGVGWATLDATPAAESAGTADHADGSWWSALLHWIERCWNDVTGFDQKARARAIAWLLALPAQLWVLSSAYPVQAVLATAVLCFWLWLRRRRRTLPPGVRELRRAARRAGLKLRPGETPRELLARAQPALADRLRRRLADAAEAHERLRYGGTAREAT